MIVGSDEFNVLVEDEDGDGEFDPVEDKTEEDIEKENNTEEE